MTALTKRLVALGDAPWSPDHRPAALVVILAGAATVALLLASFPPVNAGAFAWFAMAPLLSILPRLSARAVEWTGFVSGYLFYGISFSWFYALFGFPAVALWGLLALFFAAFCVLARTLPREMPAWQRTVLTGCFWVAIEFVRAEQWPLRFSWLSLGYSQHNQPLVLPVASWIGVYGLSFLVVAVGAALCSMKTHRAVSVSAFIILLSVLARLASPHPDLASPQTAGARVVLVQPESLLRESLYRLTEPAIRGTVLPTLVVWPEYVEQFSESEAPEAYSELREWADRHNAALVFGGVRDRGGTAFSSAAYVLGPDGKDLGVAVKHNPLPFFQDGLPGRGYPVFAWEVAGNHLQFGILMCFDLSFEPNARRLARNGADIIVVPSHEPWDWPRPEQAQHAIIAPMRAVENGVGILRSSTPGPSQIVDHHGRRMELRAGREGVLVSGPPTGGTGRTVYNRVGWLFPWVCQLVTLGWVVRCAVVGLSGRRRPSDEPFDSPRAEGTH